MWYKVLNKLAYFKAYISRYFKSNTSCVEKIIIKKKMHLGEFNSSAYTTKIQSLKNGY